MELRYKLKGTQIDLQNVMVCGELQQFVGFLEMGSEKTKWSMVDHGAKILVKNLMEEEGQH